MDDDHNGRSKFTPETTRLADAVSDSQIDNEQRILLARDLIQSVLQDIEDDRDPGQCVGEGMLQAAETVLTEALGFF